MKKVFLGSGMLVLCALLVTQCRKKDEVEDCKLEGYLYTTTNGNVFP